MSTPSLKTLFGSSSYISKQKLAQICLSTGSNFIGEPTNILFNKSIIKKYGLFNSHFVQLCDLEFWLRVGLNEGIKVVPKILAKFRVHNNLTSSQNTNSNLYRSPHLERLLLLHEYIYTPHFSILKSWLITLGKYLAAIRNFTRLANWLRNFAYDKTQINNSIFYEKSQWQEIALLYPKVENSIYSIPLKIKNWLDKKFIWRFKKQVLKHSTKLYELPSIDFNNTSCIQRATVFSKNNRKRFSAILPKF